MEPQCTKSLPYEVLAHQITKEERLRRTKAACVPPSSVKRNPSIFLEVNNKIVQENEKFNGVGVPEDPPETHEAIQQLQSTKQCKNTEHYLELINLNHADLVENMVPFTCPVCLTDQAVGQGVVLKDCIHSFCRACLVQTVALSQKAEVQCPFRDDSYSCESSLQQLEIKALVPPSTFEKHLMRSLSEAEHQAGNAFHCKTPDCKGWWIIEENVTAYPCPVCSHVNCIRCRAIHESLQCSAYLDNLLNSTDPNASMFQVLVNRGDAMACPTCNEALSKEEGCDWLACAMCHTEICWATRGPRWGPAGRGDTSAGCRCGINGVKCHSDCQYCH